MFLCYQFFNGFSGQALLDGVTSAFYNAFFTALPAGMFAGLDRPVRRLATLEAHPRAYNARPALTAAAFWRTAVLTGALHGATVFFVPYLSMRGMGGRPALDDVWTLGKTMFIAMIGVVSLEIALVTRYWTWPFALVWAGSYFLTWPWLAMLPLLYRAAGRWDIAQVGRKAGGGGGGRVGGGEARGPGPGWRRPAVCARKRTSPTNPSRPQFGVGVNLMSSPVYWLELLLVSPPWVWGCRGWARAGPIQRTGLPTHSPPSRFPKPPPTPFQIYCITFSTRYAEHAAAWLTRPRDDMILAEGEWLADRLGPGVGSVGEGGRQVSGEAGVCEDAGLAEAAGRAAAGSGTPAGRADDGEHT